MLCLIGRNLFFGRCLTSDSLLWPFVRLEICHVWPLKTLTVSFCLTEQNKQTLRQLETTLPAIYWPVEPSDQHAGSRASNKHRLHGVVYCT